MKRTVWLLAIAVLGGALMLWQGRAEERARAVATSDTSAQTAVTILELTRTREQLAKQRADLATKLATLAASSEQSQATHDQAVNAHQTNEIVLGTTAVTGPGIELTFSKAMSAAELLDLINALRNLGAEALSVNNQRFVGASWIDERGFASPVVVTAIGDQRLLDGGVRQRGGILDELGLPVEIRDVDSMAMPARS